MKMGSLVRSAILPLLLLLLASPELVASSPYVHHGPRQRYDSIFSFGNSLTDTGNNIAVFAQSSVPDPATKPPYGSTFFGRPTGRFCDGRLILDFIAEGLGLPFIPPYVGSPFASPSPAHRQGANFAVAAATALDINFFRERDIPGTPGSKFPLNISLGLQLEWFQSLKASLCYTTQECRKVFRRSLFIVGEFGVNDYDLSFQKKKSIVEIRSYVPHVIRTITMAIERLIKLGVKSLLVPGMIPLGCSPAIIAKIPDAAPTEYDSRTGCLKPPNELGSYHNALLQQSLDKLQARHPNTRIIYADFFTPIMDIVESPHKFGFREDILTICCGNSSVGCGDPEATTCSHPSTSLYWDVIHYTEAANHYIASTWLNRVNSNTRD